MACVELVAAVQAKIPGARIDYKINEPVQKLIDSVVAKPFEDACARNEWGWKHQYNLPEMVDSFLSLSEKRSEEIN